ncbi:MAG: exopolysaccharide Pel transporter PelG [Bdellovibrionales bacterium]
MAGIGFVLRKLYRQDNLSGLVGACLHSAFASAGPWLFTVLALGAIAALGTSLVDIQVLFDFRVILIYNFSFSLVISGPVFMIVTRYLSDCIYRRDVSNAPGMLLGALGLMWAVELVIAVAFYCVYAKLDTLLAISAVVNFLLLSAVWLVGIFISALRNYRLITRAFLFGMIIAVLASMSLAKGYGATGLLNGFSIGLSVIVALLLGNVLAEYPYPIRKPFAFMSYFRGYWQIAVSGLVYNMAIWIDKWMMWFAPEATKLSNGLVIYPYYDSTMFIAYLTTVPAMALFLFNTETHFFEHYTRFYRDIEKKASFAKIQRNHLAVVRSIFGSAGLFFLMQGSIAFLGTLMAPQIIAFIKGNYQQVGMLRYGLLGAFFQILTLFLLVLLTYFDNRRACLIIQTVFLATNAVFTWGSIQAGFAYYGFGYFLASFLTFILASVVLSRHVARLPYHTFISSNASVRPAMHPATE